jgi:hypothetical protein
MDGRMDGCCGMVRHGTVRYGMVWNGMQCNVMYVFASLMICLYLCPWPCMCMRIYIYTVYII